MAIMATKRITASGGSLVVNITKEAAALNLERGDYVIVELHKNPTLNVEKKQK